MVRIPGALFAGETATLHVSLTMEKDTKVEFVMIRLRGRQGWVSGAGQATTAYNVDLPSLGKRVMEEGVLEPGTKTFALSFTLPHAMAPSHQISPANARLLIDVHVSIPWWRDGRYSFVAPVRLPPPDQVARRPLVTRHPFEAIAGQPRLELSLASSTLVAGEDVVGSCAVFHMTDSKAREIEVTFEPRVTLLGHRRTEAVTGPGYRSTLRLAAGKAGQAVPFRIALPHDMTPSFKTATHEVEWYMKLGVGSFFGGKVWMTVPLTILDARAAETLPPLTLAPRLADERVLAAFERFGASRGMTVEREELDRFPDEQPALVRELGDATIRIGYAYRGERGTYLVSRVLYPRLGLALSVVPSTPLRELLSKDITIENAVWDRTHHVEGREDSQIVPFLRHALPDVILGSLVRWTDDEVVTERSIGVVDEAALAPLVSALESLATAIAHARDAIAAPAGTNTDLGEWRKLAERLGAPLTVGDLSIRGGALDMQPVDLGLDFDEQGRAKEMRIGVGERQPQTDEVPERVREMLATIAKDLPDVGVSSGVAWASIPLTAGGTDATRVREVVRSLRGVVAALVESAGPYR